MTRNNSSSSYLKASSFNRTFRHDFLWRNKHNDKRTLTFIPCLILLLLLLLGDCFSARFSIDALNDFPIFFPPRMTCAAYQSRTSTFLTLLDIRKCISVRSQCPSLCPCFLLITLLIRHAVTCFGRQSLLILLKNRLFSLNEPSIDFFHFSSRAFEELL